MKRQRSDKPLLGFLSGPAQVLFLVSAGLVLFGFYLTIKNGVFPSGSYPLWILLFPSLAVSTVFFFLGCGVLRLLKIPVIKETDRKDAKVEEKTTERDAG
jgi:hypothetical protein